MITEKDQALNLLTATYGAIYKNPIEISSELDVKFEIIEKILTHKIPEDIKRLLALNYDMYEEDLFFNQLYPLTLNDVINTLESLDYQSEKLLGYLTCEANDMVDNFKIKNESEFPFSIYKEGTEEKELSDEDLDEQDYEIHFDVSHLLPLASDQEAYVLLDLRDGRIIATASYDGSASVLSPSLKDHIEDALKGIKEGKYSFDDEQEMWDIGHDWHDANKDRGLLE